MPSDNELADMMAYVASRNGPTASDDPDQRRIDALEKALRATTPKRAGSPWDVPGEENHEEKERLRPNNRD